MKLQLKHLSPYLPYGLKLRKYSGDLSNPILIGIQENYYWQSQYDFKTKNCEQIFTRPKIKSGLDACEPIMKSLFNFCDREYLKDVQEYIGIENWCEAYDQYFDIWFDDLANVDKLVLQAPYVICQYFFANHYDVFGLIKKGLAIDINMLSVENGS